MVNEKLRSFLRSFLAVSIFCSLLLPVFSFAEWDGDLVGPPEWIINYMPQKEVILGWGKVNGVYVVSNNANSGLLLSENIAQILNSKGIPAIAGTHEGPYAAAYRAEIQAEIAALEKLPGWKSFCNTQGTCAEAGAYAKFREMGYSDVQAKILIRDYMQAYRKMKGGTTVSPRDPCMACRLGLGSPRYPEYAIVDGKWTELAKGMRSSRILTSSEVAALKRIPGWEKAATSVTRYGGKAVVIAGVVLFVLDAVSRTEEYSQGDVHTLSWAAVDGTTEAALLATNPAWAVAEDLAIYQMQLEAKFYEELSAGCKTKWTLRGQHNHKEFFEIISDSKNNPHMAYLYLEDGTQIRRYHLSHSFTASDGKVTFLGASARAGKVELVLNPNENWATLTLSNVFTYVYEGHYRYEGTYRP